MKLILLLTLLLATQVAFSQQIADSFIFPVKGDNVTVIHQNTLDPRAGGLPGTLNVANDVGKTGPGGWYDNMNSFGNECSSCPGGSNYPYHPGTDYNRYDGAENDGDDVPVYSIGNGRVIRIHRTTSLGWSVSVRYDFPETADLSDYVYPGTTPTSVIQNASGVVAFYFHLAGNVLNSATDEWTSWDSGETLNSNKGVQTGYIRSAE